LSEEIAVARFRRAPPRSGPAKPAAAVTDVQSMFVQAARCHQARRLIEAAALYARILALRPDLADVHCNLGAALADLGRPDDAEAAYRRAIALKPDFAGAHNNLGNLLKHLGRLDEAEGAYRDAIACRGDIGGTLSNLGTVLASLGRLGEAEAAYRRAIALMPRHAATYNNLANALKDLDRLDEAEAVLRQAIALAPDYPEAYSNLGNVLRDLGRLDEAEAALLRAIALKPGYPQAHSNLGNTLLALGRRDDAEAAYRRAIALKPDYPEAHSNLGLALKEAGHLDDAEAALRRAIALRPDYPEARSNLGNVLKDIGRLAEAEAVLRETIALRPKFAPAYHNLANVLKEAGRMADASAAAEEAMRLSPDNTLYFRNLGEIRRFFAGEPVIAAMETLARTAQSLAVADRIELHFGLAKAYEDLGRRDDAFSQLLAGNALKRRHIVYPEAAILGAMERVPQVFTPELIRSRRHAGDPSPVPVFIVGMMRSGSTLVEQILASHPDVFGAGELKVFGNVVRDFRPDRGDATDIFEMASNLSDDQFRDIGARYLAAVKPLAPAAARITDKMPSNFFLAGLIHLALPNAAIIHTVRDPLDTCLSCFSKLFAEAQNHTYDLAEIGRYYRHYRALMAHWHGVLPPGRILDVRYEDVVADLEGTARRILAHCGLAWDARCLDFHRTERPVQTASAAQVRQPIYASSVGRARASGDELTPLIAELAAFAPVGGD
jgi:tetratricopeptide (TPR) repeat protein